MKFKCGLTEEEENSKRAEAEANWLKILKEGQVWFAWFPVRIKKGDCRWLEKVKRFPSKVGYQEILFGSYVSIYDLSVEGAARSLAGGGTVGKYRYEAIQPE